MKNYEKIKTVADAYIACGLDPEKRPDVSSFPGSFQKYMANHFDLIIIVKAINKRDDGTFWEPDWNDPDQRKWFPWPDVDADDERPSGFGFSGAACDFWNAHTVVGSRLCFETREQAVFAFENFNDHYKENLLILK
jgi:hypothetical protein